MNPCVVWSTAGRDTHTDTQRRANQSRSLELCRTETGGLSPHTRHANTQTHTTPSPVTHGSSRGLADLHLPRRRYPPMARPEGRLQSSKSKKRFARALDGSLARRCMTTMMAWMDGWMLSAPSPGTTVGGSRDRAREGEAATAQQTASRTQQATTPPPASRSPSSGRRHHAPSRAPYASLMAPHGRSGRKRMRRAAPRAGWDSVPRFKATLETRRRERRRRPVTAPSWTDCQCQQTNCNGPLDSSDPTQAHAGFDRRQAGPSICIGRRKMCRGAGARSRARPATDRAWSLFQIAAARGETLIAVYEGTHSVPRTHTAD
jgi:hypothetical protein